MELLLCCVIISISYCSTDWVREALPNPAKTIFPIALACGGALTFYVSVHMLRQ